MASRRGGGGGRRGGRGTGGHASRPTAHDSSQPTGRAAYADTRAWLLRTHGHVCAYCGLEYPPRELTLDHVTPRRGQTAYDRRDNLVLACKRCNAAKADKSFVAWILGARARAVHLFHYGQHLSEGILEMLRPIVGDEKPAARPPRTPAKPAKGSKGGRQKAAKPRKKYGPDKHDAASPYHEPSPYLDG
jgi:hypothetical protein